jgi:predicted small lipoprotein YifL
MLFRIFNLVLITSLLLLSTACGQKGPLYIQEEIEEQQQETSTETASEAINEKNGDTNDEQLPQKENAENQP